MLKWKTYKSTTDEQTVVYFRKDCDDGCGVVNIPVKSSKVDENGARQIRLLFLFNIDLENVMVSYQKEHY